MRGRVPAGVARAVARAPQMQLAGLEVAKPGDPDECSVCRQGRGRFTTVVIHGKHVLVCKSCAQQGYAPTLERRNVG